MRQPKCSCGLCKYCIKRDEYLRHRESYIRRSSQYQRKYKEQTNAKNARWKKLNACQVLISHKKRRIRLKSEGRMSAIDRRRDLSKNYGVTQSWFDAKLLEQGGGCALCGSKVSRATNRNLHVDHNHNTDYVRGILCHHCNACLRAIEEDREWAAKAQAYLDKYDMEWQAEMAARYGSKS